MLTSLFNKAVSSGSLRMVAIGLSALALSTGSGLAQKKKKEIRKIDITRNSNLVSKMVVGSVDSNEKLPQPVMKKTMKPTQKPAMKPMPKPADVSNFVVGSISRQSNLLNYCLNISDAATEARASMLLRMLKDREAEMMDVISQLEEKTAALTDWMEKREKFLANANSSLISIFESMRPDAAAQQLTAMDIGLAAAIIMKLKPKISSIIMAEMKAKNAAKIASLMTSAIDQSPVVKTQ